MSTRSLIGKLTIDGNVVYIYCHDSGSPSYVGRLLDTYYRKPRKIVSLLSYGFLSRLAKNIGKKHGFDYSQRPADECTFYGRDRGDDHCDAVTCTLDSYPFEADGYNAEYLYLYRDGAWQVMDMDQPGQWQVVSDVLAVAALA